MNIGLRDSQEDCIFVDGKVFQERSFPKVAVAKKRKDNVLFAVCDGMGGHSRGEWASRFVCEKLKENLRNFHSSRNSVEFLIEAIQNKMENEMVSNSGTTIAGVALRDDRAEVFNAGDSRVYKITGGGITYVSHDHSLVQSGIDRGDISPAEAFAHPYKNVIEFGMGDVFKDAWARGDRATYRKDDYLAEGEYYLICTDGVNDVLRDEEMDKILDGDPFGNLSALVEFLKERMKDNFSFILVARREEKGRAVLK